MKKSLAGLATWCKKTYKYYGYEQRFADNSYRYAQKFTDNSYGYAQKFTDNSPIFSDFLLNSPIFSKFLWFSLFFSDFLRFSLKLSEFLWFSLIFSEYPVFSSYLCTRKSAARKEGGGVIIFMKVLKNDEALPSEIDSRAFFFVEQRWNRWERGTGGG